MRNKQQTGFTIVELLIVIVVIAILAAITIVAYNGIKNGANVRGVQSDLGIFGGMIWVLITTNDSIPVAGATDMGPMNLKASKSAYGAHYTLTTGAEYNMLYCRNSSAFILVAAAKSGNVFVYRDGGVKTGVGPLTTHTTTCQNNGLATTGSWFYSDGAWQSWVK